MNYQGDLEIKQDNDGNFDLCFENGQPCMTAGLETYVILAVFGENWWGNDIVKSSVEQMKSEFPNVIKRNVVTDRTKNDGTKAIEKALAAMESEKIARSVSVTGSIVSANAISWTVDIIGLDNRKYQYFINWEQGSVTAQIVRV